MPLAPGSRIGVYEVTGLLGAGGMGEVYRARDTRLNRDVALKVLPDLFAADPERLARFEREAQLLASLNHPHIAQIYGIEGRALVMELVEGDTLADRIAGAALPVDEAVAIARQIAEALAAAHDQGIVHRDLKPANVNVTPDGVVKVLDFGLAKLNDAAASPEPNVSASPTFTSPAMRTGAGVILGTAAYMAPEQARGKAIDKRADLWAFGCVLYEMLTGTRAFAGEDVTETLANVLKSEPDWRTLPASLPVAIRRLLGRCLEKDRARRVADAATVLFVIDEAASLGLGTTASAAERDGGRLLRPLLALAVFLAVVGAVVVWSLGASRPPQGTMRFAITVGEGQLTSLARNQMAVSPDGNRLVYYQEGRAFLRELSDFDARSIPGSYGQTAFSPDGRSLAVYDVAERTIKRMGLVGGSAVTVCAADNPFGMTWDESGIVSGQGTGGVLRCPLDGSAPERLATVAEGEQADRPQILPGGDALLFTIARTAEGPGRWDSARIVVQSLNSGERKTVVEGGSAARYVPSGHLLYARGGVVFAVPFDVGRREVTGQAVAVIEGVRRVGGAVTGGAQFAISDSGNLFYIPGPAITTAIERTIAVADRAGVVRRLTIPPGPYTLARAARDGSRLAVETDNGKDAAIWMYTLAGTSALQRLTLGGRNRFPVWSPDGARIAFQSDRDGDPAVFVQRVDGTGRAERLTKAGAGVSHVPDAWSPDGRHILVSVANGREFSLWTLSVADGTLAPLGITSVEAFDAVFSPDGRWIAYRSGRFRRDLAGSSSDVGVFVQPFPATGAVYPAPRVGVDFHPVWGPDGKELIYVRSAATRQLVAVAVTVGTGLTFAAPVAVPARVTANRINGQPRAFDILPDGTFVGPVEPTSADGSPENAPSEIRVVLNWLEELTRLVPVP